MFVTTWTLDVILSSLMKSFSSRIGLMKSRKAEHALAAKGVRAIHPDDFIMRIAEKNPDVVHDAVRRLVESKQRPPRTMDEELAGLRTSRLNKLANFIENCDGKTAQPPSSK